MSHISLRCTGCGADYAADVTTLACVKCSAPLDVEYADRGDGPIPMPFHDPDTGTSLGEGDTPCVGLPAIGELLGLRRLYGKLEFVNPTGSFKDRGASVMIAVAAEHGATELVEDSSGNAGASVSAYAARAGIKAHIFAPAGAPAAKLRQIEAYGAQVHMIEGSRNGVTAAAVAYHTEHNLVYASHALSPYFLEGTKTFAYEVVLHFPQERDIPQHILFPVGNGSLIIGTWKGLKELRDDGRIKRLPRLHCVQAQAVMPIVAAYRDEDWRPDAAATTIAGGIAVGAPARQQQVVEALRSTDGAAVAVQDSDILRWREWLAIKEGVLAEATSAAAFAGLELLVKQGVVAPDDAVLVPITGSGLKDGATV